MSTNTPKPIAKARSTDLNSGLSVHLETIEKFCACLDCLMKGKHNRLNLVDCAEQGILNYI
jgi:hypothetical protein